MRTNDSINRLATEARRERRCIAPSSPAEDRALRRRAEVGEMTKPFPGLFACTEYWNQLVASERIVHIARSLAGRHPQWVFAGPTAAAIHGFEHQWSIHEDGVFIVSRHAQSGRNKYGVNRIYMTDDQALIVQSLAVTSPARTVLDCARLLSFHHALPIADSALSMHPDLLERIGSLRCRRDRTPVERIVRYANPLSDNGGESLARAIMIEEGFPIPALQRVFTDPRDPRHWYRADFTWSFPDGRIIVAEYDGLRKYVDPTMTDRQSIKSVVHQQTQRERDLMAWGVTAIVRFDYEDAVRRQPLANKLIRAGIPQYARPW